MTRIGFFIPATLAGLLLLGGLSACGEEGDLLCEPASYRCGGLEGSIVEYCESSGERWQTLTDCSELGERCEEGACVPAGDQNR